MNDARDREVVALIASSALSRRVSRWFERVDAAWARSASRRVAGKLGPALADRRGAAVTVATAAVVALLLRMWMPVPEPGTWMVPAGALLWAAATLVRTARPH